MSEIKQPNSSSTPEFEDSESNQSRFSADEFFTEPSKLESSRFDADAAPDSESEPPHSPAELGQVPPTKSDTQPLVTPPFPPKPVVTGEARPMYRVSPAEPPDWSEYSLPPLDDDYELKLEDDSSSWKTAWSVVREVGETIILTLIIFLIIQAFIRNFRVVGTSMVGNLHDGQYLIIDKVSYNSFLIDYLGVGGPQRGDVVVFEPPNRPDDDYVKRVIGLPGETVEIINGQVFINNEPLDEPFQPKPGSYSTPARVVPEGQVFVLGDNRNNSNDSHTWGPLPIENIVGRAWISYWPPTLWGTIPRDVPTSEATLKHLVEELVPSANAENK
ncbi:MAG: signal peptidase I [Anaerolineae bacterium]|nr:signal peptidase I [Anaerolineae bacterium]